MKVSDVYSELLALAKTYDVMFREQDGKYLIDYCFQVGELKKVREFIKDVNETLCPYFFVVVDTIDVEDEDRYTKTTLFMDIIDMSVIDQIELMKNLKN